MKKYIIILFVLTLPTISTLAESLSQQVETAYKAKQYDQVINLLEKEITAQKEQGFESADLYYNLGNAYFRDNNIAKAMLNYERAKLLKPNDKEIQTNIIFVQTKLEDKFAEKNDFFLTNIINSVQNIASSNTWTIISIIFFLLFLGSLGIFLFIRNIIFKKAAFYTGLVIVVLLVFSNIFAYRQTYKIENRNTAVVMRNTTPAYSEPNASNKELFILNSGSKVKIKKEDGDWYQVEIINGDKGWIQKNRIEII